jgi:hypothetical protein
VIAAQGLGALLSPVIERRGETRVVTELAVGTALYLIALLFAALWWLEPELAALLRSSMSPTGGLAESDPETAVETAVEKTAVEKAAVDSERLPMGVEAEGAGSQMAPVRDVLDPEPAHGVEGPHASQRDWLAVERTFWHPLPDRRRAEMEWAGDEPMLTLREGDAVGRLVVLEIKPSGVVFEDSDRSGMRIERRVGERLD